MGTFANRNGEAVPSLIHTRSVAKERNGNDTTTPRNSDHCWKFPATSLNERIGASRLSSRWKAKESDFRTRAANSIHARLFQESRSTAPYLSGSFARSPWFCRLARPTPLRSHGSVRTIPLGAASATMNARSACAKSRRGAALASVNARRAFARLVWSTRLPVRPQRFPPNGRPASAFGFAATPSISALGVPGYPYLQ